MGDLTRPGDSPKGSSLHLPPHTAHTKGKGYLSIQMFPRVKDFPALQPGVTHACNSVLGRETQEEYPSLRPARATQKIPSPQRSM